MKKQIVISFGFLLLLLITLGYVYNFSFMNNPIIDIVLLSLGFIGIAFFVTIPTIKSTLILSVLSFFIYFYGNISVREYLNFIPIISFIVGFLLLFLETLIPGFGILGISGVIFTLYGLIVVKENSLVGIFIFSTSLIISILFVYTVMRFLKVSPVFDKIILRDFSGRYDETKNDYFYLIKKTGKTITMLRPSGKIDIEGEGVFDVLTEGSFINKGVEVEVYKVIGNKIFVRRVC